MSFLILMESASENENETVPRTRTRLCQPTTYQRYQIRMAKVKGSEHVNYAMKTILLKWVPQKYMSLYTDICSQT